MTVCISAYCFSTNCLIGICDSMLSMPDMSADRLAIKNFSIGNSWMCMFSANDLSPVNSSFNIVREQASGEVTLEEIVAAFRLAFRKELIVKAESSILSSFGMDMNEFRQSGLANFGSEIFSRIVYQIEQLSLEITFLVYGFDKDKAHIFSIQNKGEVSHFDQPGFWAIGSGQTSALGSLFNLSGPSLVVRPFEDILYLLCRAKFSSESAPGVGKWTSIFVLNSNGDRSVAYESGIRDIKRFWDQNRPPDVPVEGRKAAQELVKILKKIKPAKKKKSKRSVSETSEPEQ